MKHCSIYLATAEGEWSGLPALEAMSAGCVVVSVPVLGGMEYLDDGVNCRMAGPRDFTAAFGDLLNGVVCLPALPHASGGNRDGQSLHDRNDDAAPFGAA